MAKLKLEDGTEVEAFTEEELKEKLEQETSGLKAKVEELLGEKKTVAQKLKEQEEAQAKAEEQRQKEQGEYKSLYEKIQTELEGERQAARQFREQVQAKSIESEAYKLASSLTKDTKRAELLAKEARQYAQFGDDGVKFEVGGIAMDNTKLAEKLKADFPFLVDGSGATGGGANGSGSRAPDVKQVTRQEFDQMSHADRSTFAKDGGKVVDND